MLLDDLLASKHISYEEYRVYMLFQISEMGREWFQTMMLITFMDEASPEGMGIALAVTEGRRGIFRDIQRTVDKINHLLEVLPHDDREQGTE